MPELSKKVSHKINNHCKKTNIGLYSFTKKANWEITHKVPKRTVPKSPIGWYLNEQILNNH